MKTIIIECEPYVVHPKKSGHFQVEEGRTSARFDVDTVKGCSCDYPMYVCVHVLATRIWQVQVDRAEKHTRDALQRAERERTEKAVAAAEMAYSYLLAMEEDEEDDTAPWPGR